MKYIVLVFVLFLSNLIFSQNDSIPSEEEIFARDFTLSNPVQLPDYPCFKGIKLNTIGNCLAMLDLFNGIKENIDFTNERNQILNRLSEMSTILANENIFVYLKSGLDCSFEAKKSNEKFNKTRVLYIYICIAACTISKGFSDGKEAFNKATQVNQKKKK